MSKYMLWLFSTVFLFTACTPMDQSVEATITLQADIRPSTTTDQKPTKPASPLPKWTATITTEPTLVPSPHPTITPTTTDSPFLDIELYGQAIEFWHVWGNSSAGKAITEIVYAFNAQNIWDIEVIAMAKDNYGELERDLYTTLSRGDEPNLIMAYSNVLSDLWYQEILVDLNIYFHDVQYGLPPEAQADFYPGVLNAGNLEGARVGFPFSQSGNVIFYNRTWAKELGFQNPPTNAAEITLQACAATLANNQDLDLSNDGTGGFVLYPGTANILSWIYAFEGEIFDPDTQQYTFNTPSVQGVARFLQDLVHQGCAYQTRSYPNPEFATRKALFTTSSSVGCQYQQKEFERPGSMRDDWEVMSFPGQSGLQAIVIFPQMLGLVDQTPEQNLAAWLFMQYLTSPEVQAKWVMESQYYPARISIWDLMTAFSSSHPQWASGIDLLNQGRSEPNHPSWGLVRQYVQETFVNLIETHNVDNHKMLADLDSAAVEAVAESSRIISSQSK